MLRMPFKQGDRILFQGDSVTDVTGTAMRLFLGSGYPALIPRFFGAIFPDEAHYLE